MNYSFRVNLTFNSSTPFLLLEYLHLITIGIDCLNTTFIFTVDRNIFVIVYVLVQWCLKQLEILGGNSTILNMTLYSMTGYQHSISISFCALDDWDLGFFIISIKTNSFQVAQLVAPHLQDFYCGDMLFGISAWVKTFIGLQRVCCVAFQFHINIVFTNKSTAVRIFCLCIFYMVSYANDIFFKGILLFQSVDKNEIYLYGYINGVAVSIKVRSYIRTMVACNF